MITEINIRSESNKYSWNGRS